MKQSPFPATQQHLPPTPPLRPRGSDGVPVTGIQNRVRDLLVDENQRKPLSDARIADTLKSEGMPAARRTVAKYREALHMPDSHERVRIGRRRCAPAAGNPPAAQ